MAQPTDAAGPALSGAMASGQEDGLATRTNMQTEISEKQEPSPSSGSTSPNHSHSASEHNPEEAKEILHDAEKEIRSDQ